jgi:hypothetical protein
MTSVRETQRVIVRMICYYDNCNSCCGQVACVLQCTILMQERKRSKCTCSCGRSYSEPV